MRDWLKSLRLEHGYTLKDMSEKLCISESYYAMIESGDRQKRMDLALAAGISVVFGIPVAEIVSMEQEAG